MSQFVVPKNIHTSLRMVLWFELATLFPRPGISSLASR